MPAGGKPTPPRRVGRCASDGGVVHVASSRDEAKRCPFRSPSAMSRLCCQRQLKSDPWRRAVDICAARRAHNPEVTQVRILPGGASIWPGRAPIQLLAEAGRATYVQYVPMARRRVQIQDGQLSSLNARAGCQPPAIARSFQQPTSRAWAQRWTSRLCSPVAPEVIPTASAQQPANMTASTTFSTTPVSGRIRATTRETATTGSTTSSAIRATRTRTTISQRWIPTGQSSYQM
jgi:hypothetical protein